jgi:hypothetical protein
MREALLNFLERWSRDETASIPDALADSEVRRCRNALLPKGTPVEDWIDRRIGGEVETRVVDGQTLVALYGQIEATSKPVTAGSFESNKRSGLCHQFVTTGKCPYGKNCKFSHDTDEREPATRGSQSVTEFFDKFPADGFLREEEELREILLDFLDAWPREGRPTLTDVSADPEVRRCLPAILPKGSPATFLDWIENRVGAEFEVDSDQHLIFKDELAGGEAKDEREGGDRAKGKGKRKKGKSDKVLPGDWTCPGCGVNVFATKDACFKCGARRDSDGSGKRRW